jgi:hypothetical protein
MRIRIQLFTLNADPNPAFHSNVDPDPASKNNMNPYPHLWLIMLIFLVRYWAAAVAAAQAESRRDETGALRHCSHARGGRRPFACGDQGTARFRQLLKRI